MGTTTAVYVRISRDKREGSGLGVKRQEQDCRTLAESLGFGDVQLYADNDISAFSGKLRPQYQAMLAAMRAGQIGRVIAWHTDRLHRSPRELEEYIDASDSHGIATYTVKAGHVDLTTPAGRAIARTLGAWARYESEHTAERIVRKKRELAEEGKFGGGPVPFGYMKDTLGRIVIDTERGPEVQRAVRAVIAGASIGSIVKDLNTRGIPTGRGGKWTSTAVRNMVTRPTNAGVAVYQGLATGATSVFPPVVSEDEWRAASRIVRDPSRRSQFDSRVKHLLAGLAICGTCGTPMKTSSRARDSGPNRFFYKCPQAGGGHAFQTAAPLEDYVSRVIVGRLQQPDALELFASPDDGDRRNQIQEELVTLRARLETHYQEAADGELTARGLAVVEKAMLAKIDGLEDEMAHMRVAGVLAEIPLSSVAEWWTHTIIEKRRAVIDALAVVYVDPIGRAAPRVFDASRVRIEPRSA